MMEKNYTNDGFGGSTQHVNTVDSDRSVISTEVWPDSDPRMKKLRLKVDIRICLSLGVLCCSTTI